MLYSSEVSAYWSNRKTIGWWRETDQENNLPSLAKAPVGDYTDAEKERIVTYLVGGETINETPALHQLCASEESCGIHGHLCYRYYEDNNGYRRYRLTHTDGEYIWRSETRHYVLYHRLLLPEAFFHKIQTHEAPKFVPPPRDPQGWTGIGVSSFAGIDLDGQTKLIEKMRIRAEERFESGDYDGARRDLDVIYYALTSKQQEYFDTLCADRGLPEGSRRY